MVGNVKFKNNHQTSRMEEGILCSIIYVCAHVVRVEQEREIFIDDVLVRIYFIIVMIKRTFLVPWEFGGRTFQGSNSKKGEVFTYVG